MTTFFLLLFNNLFSQENVYTTSTSTSTLFTDKIKFNQRKWNKIRTRIEKNLPPYEISVSTARLEIPKVETPTTIEFIEGTQLNIAGRKLIGIEIKETVYPNDSKRNYGIQPTMKQELQVRIRGKVGNNVDVNVDIDDTQPDKRDISIVYRGESIETTPGAGGVGYKGKKDAVIQEAAFGDITLSLPNSEFVGYQRQVFGVKAIGQFRVGEDRVGKAYFIASQSKGNFETKRFVGTTQFERREILDVSYIPRKYYRLSFGNDKIQKGSVRVYVDDMDATNNTNTINLTAQSYHSSTITYTGNFDLLAIGRDYVIDYSTGIIIFSIPNKYIQSNWVIAVDYIDENTGLSLRDKLGTTNYILIKDMNNDFSRELKNRYNIGTKNIVRDNGLGNFILKIVDKSNTVPTSILPDNKSVPKYPNDIIVNFETGEFYFTSEQPFNSDCYSKTPISRYNIIVEYRSRLKTYNLKPFLVPQSERVYIDGQLLRRDVDYFIDYDSGFLTFLKEERITETSVIEVSYEYSMLGLQGGETLAGGRLEIPLHQKIFVGGSVLGNLPSKGTNRPDVRSTPSSLQVWETDARIVDVSLPFGIPLRLNSLSAEYANSKKNPNIWNEAVIENMEGITLEDTVSTYKDFWRYGSTLLGDVYNLNEITWSNEDVLIKDINPNKITTTDKQQVLKVDYDLHTSSEVAIVYSFSKIGLDFTKKIYLDIDIYSDGTAGKGRLLLDLGQMKEDIDNDGILDTEDKNNNGKLDLGEDIGFEYNTSLGKSYNGKENGLLDSEDLDNDGVLKTFDSLAGTYDLGELNFSGWISTRVFITVSNQEIWSTVKHIRLRVQGHNTKGTFKIAKISVVGNKWENKTPSKAQIYAVNNENDKNYVKNTTLISENTSSLLYQQTNSEQALAIKYDFVKSTDYALCQIMYTRAHDFTFHRRFNFFIFNDGNEVNLTVRAYRDDYNFVEYSTITALTNTDKWSKIVIEQEDINKDEVPDTWVLAKENTSGGVCISTGIPKLDAISKIEVIVKATKDNQKGVIYINDMYLSDSWIKEGIAKKLDFDLSIPGWTNFGSKFKTIDRKFETFTSAVTNQDRTETSAYLNFSKIGFMPMGFQGKQSITVTPSAIKSGNLVSELDEGEVLRTEGSMTTSINLGSRWLPQISGSYSKSVSSATELSRTEIIDNYTGAVNYSLPISNVIAFIPTNIGISGSEIYTYISPWNLQISTPTRDKSRELNFLLPFNFWNQLILNFNAGTKNIYSEITMPETRLDTQLVIPRLSKMDSTDLINYWYNLAFFAPRNLPKDKSDIYETAISTYTKQKVWKTGANTSLNIIPFFKPTANYDISITEDYKIPLYDKKDILRNASGNYGVSFAPRNIVDLKIIRSLNINYNRSLIFGDKYENLSKDLEIVDLYEFRNLKNLWFEQTISTPSRTQWLNQIGQRASVSWKLFEGIKFPHLLSFLNKTDVTANYSDEDKQEEITGTFRQTYTKVWPDINSIFYDIDKLSQIFWEKSKVSNSRLDVRYTYKTVETKKVSYEFSTYHREVLSFDLFRHYNVVGSYDDTVAEKYSLILNTATWTMTERVNNFGWSLQVGFPFLGQRLTPKYDYRKDFTEDVKRVATRDLVTHTFSVRYYADIIPKQGIKLLWFGNIPLQNRIIIDTNVSYVRSESSLDVKTNNVDQVQLSSTMDYEVSRYIRLRLGGGYQHNTNRAVDKETNYSYNISGQLTITF